MASRLITDYSRGSIFRLPRPHRTGPTIRALTLAAIPFLLWWRPSPWNHQLIHLDLR
jgi:hypothetical protein